jgi:hypothetical protein
MLTLEAARAEVEGVFAGLPYDKRLRDRVIWCAGRLMDAPAASFPAAFGPAGYTAFWRMLHNPRVQEHAPWAAVFAATERAVADRRIIIAHDPTECRFGGVVRRAGLGRMSQHDQGFVAMFSLAIDRDAPARVLGVAAALCHVRDEVPRAAQSRAAAERDPDRESQLWPAALRAAAAVTRGATSALHLFDAGADDYAFLAELVGGGHAFVLHGTQDRCTAAARPDGRAVHVADALATAAVTRATRTVSLGARPAKRTKDAAKVHPARPARSAHLAVRAATLTLRRPHRAPATLPATLPLNLVQEIDPPIGQEPVQWWLWTTEPVATAAEALAVVDAYLRRWTIEEFFFALKTGCAYERRQLESLDALWVVLALCSPIAVQLLNLRALEAQAPQTPADTVVEPTLIDVARAMEPRRLAAARPSVTAFLQVVARLGGHLPHNGPPGWRVLMRGFQKVALAAEGWNAALEFMAAKATQKSDQS